MTADPDTPPAAADTSAVDLEEAVLAKICAPLADGLESGMLVTVEAGLAPEHFTSPALSTLFRELLRRYEAGSEFDPIAAIFAAEENGELDPGDRAYLIEVTGRETMRSGLAENCRALAERAAKRRADALAHRAELYLRDGNREQAAQLLREAAEATDSAAGEAAPPFTDLDEILAGDFEPERPTLGILQGGGALLYSGRINEIHGEPSVGKTNIALAIIADALAEGKRVLFADPEDNPKAIVRRLLAFGADPEAIRERFRYLHDPDPKDLRRAIKWAKKNPPDLAGFDGLAELLAGQAIPEKDETGILTFFRDFIRPFADAGAAVLLTDHVVKNAETRGQWARGSGAKMGRYDGASYEAALIKSYSPETAGAIKLKVSKDRNGGVGPKGTVAAEIHFEPNDGDGTSVEIRSPEQRGEFMPTALMEKVSREIEADPAVSYRTLRTLGKVEYVNQAIAKLEAQGNITITRPGAGRPNTYTIVERFRESSPDE